MAEIGIVDYFVMGEAVGIVATLLVGFYYSRKQMQKLSVDIESKILNDLEDKLHGISEMALAQPELSEVIDRDSTKWGAKVTFAMNILNVYAYAFHMRQRNVLSDNEWNGYIQHMKAAFKDGSISDHWKIVQPEKWFDSEFRDFIENEIMPTRVSNR
jgi:hypothetical protein